MAVSHSAIVNDPSSTALDAGSQSATATPGHLHWWTDLLVIALLVAAHAVAYPRVFLHGEVISPAAQLFSYPPWNALDPAHRELPYNNVLSDEVDSMMPTVGYVRDSLLRGDLPAWCDKTQNGTPLFWVVTHHMLLLPLVLLVLPLGAAEGMTAFVLLRQILGGLFFFKYCRIMGLGRWAAICGAIVFTFGSFPVQTFGRSLSFQLVMLPITLYAIERILRDRSLCWTAALPFLLHFNIVSGFPAGTVYCFYFIGLYAVIRVLGESGRQLRLLGLGLLLGGVALVISAPALLATADYFAQFDWGYRAVHGLRTMPAATWLTFFFPFLCGPPTSRAPLLGLAGDHFWWFEHCIYVGVLPLLITIVGCSWRRIGGIRLFYLLFAAWLLCLFFNTGGILDLLQNLPVFSSSRNTRQKVLFFFILSILAAWALDDLSKVRRGAASRWVGLFLLTVLAAVVVALVWGYYGDQAPPPFVSAHRWVQGSVFGASLLVAGTLLGTQHPSRLLKIAAGILVFLDLQLMDRTSLGLRNDPALTVRENLRQCFLSARPANWNPTIPRDRFFPTTPGICFLQANTGEHQILAMGTSFLSNAPLYYGVNNFSGRAFTTAREKELYRLVAPDAFANHATQYLFRSSSATRLDRQFVDALGIKYVVLGPGSRPEDLSRDYLLQQKEWSDNLMLRPGGVLVQHLLAPRGMVVDRLTVRCAEFGLADVATLSLRIRDVATGQLWEYSDAEWRPETGTLEFDLAARFFERGRKYALEIRRADESEGSLRLLCTRGVYILRCGPLLLDGREHPGELTFALFRDAGRRDLLHQPEWNDSFLLQAGESAAQTFVASHSLTAPRVSVRLADNHLADPNGLRLTVVDLDTGRTAEPAAGTWQPSRGEVRFDLPAFRFEARRPYRLELAVDADNAGTAELRCTNGVDLIPSGELSVRGVPRSGDLTLSVRSTQARDLSRYRVVHTGDMTILENTAVFDRAFLVGGVRLAEDQEILAGLREGTEDLRWCAWVAEADRAAVGDPLPPRTVAGRAVAEQLRSSRQRFRATADTDCYLIVRDNHHRHWRAWVDGRETPIFRANYNMRGIRLPAGEHVVEFGYQPPYQLPALGAAFLGGGAFLGAIIHVGRRRKSAAARCSPPTGR